MDGGDHWLMGFEPAPPTSQVLAFRKLWAGEANWSQYHSATGAVLMRVYTRSYYTTKSTSLIVWAV